LPDSILELISQNMLATLNTIRVSNGYSQDITFARPLRKGRQPDNDTGVLFITDLAEHPDQDVSNQLQRFIVQYEIEIYLFYSEYDLTPVDQEKANIFADICKALYIDAQRGAPSDAHSPHLALDTQVTGMENFFDADGGFEGMTINVLVDFRVFRNDPYLAA